MKNFLARKEEKASRTRAQSIQLWLKMILGLAFIIALVVGAQYIMEQDRLRAENAGDTLDKSPIAVDRKRDYGEAGFRQVAENEWLILSADFTTGEISVEQKATGMIWYSNPQSRNDSGIKGVKSRLNSQFIYSAFNVKTAAITTYDSFSQSVRQGGMNYELIENGIKFTYAFPTTGIIIPLCYTLQGESLEVSIPGDEIQELWRDRFVAYTIEVLPFFGASGLDDEGYILVPDGSGALMALNSDKYTYAAYTGTIYGLDRGYSTAVEPSLSETITMPVYGMKVNDAAFMTVITQGAGNGQIMSYLSRKATSYNQVYSRVNLMAFRTKVAGAGTPNAMNVNDDVKYGIDMTPNMIGGSAYTQKYFFLHGEEATYTGMSRCYREYLSSEEELLQSDLTDRQYLILDVYGAVTLTEVVMGVEREVVTELTSYLEVCDMVRQLKEQGVDNLIINYVGGLRGGWEGELLDAARYEPALGSQREFEEMMSYLGQEGVVLFFESDPVRLYEDGNGFNRQTHAVKGLFEEFAQYTSFVPAGIKQMVEPKDAYLVRQQYVPEIMQKFASTADALGIQNIAVNGLGNILYSNHAKGEAFISREGTIGVWGQAAANARQYAEHLMVHRGNMYTAAYADVITDVAPGASGYDVEDRAIPFYQMTLHGNIVLGTQPINDTADYEYALLQAVESGSSIKYNVMAADSALLVHTAYSKMVSYEWDNWADTIVNQYHRMQAVTGDLAGEQIVFHEQLANGVTQTTYSSGVQVIVNYNEEPYQADGLLVNGRSYVRMEVENDD